MIPPVTLEGPRLTLTPLCSHELTELYSVLSSKTSWIAAERDVNSQLAFEKFVEPFFRRQEKFEGLTFVARVKQTGKIAAMSSYWNPSHNLTKIEIGFTWVADHWMRTFVNTEQKYLMLLHAFETLKVKRVEFSVDPANEKSNVAMKRLGAVCEGTLRKWRFLSENDKGHRNLYSIIDDEWLTVKTRLEVLLR